MKEEQREIATALIGESEELDIWGLPVFRVYASKENHCQIIEEKKEIELAIAESIQYVDKSQRTVVLLLVEIIPMSQRRRRRRRVRERRGEN